MNAQLSNVIPGPGAKPASDTETIECIFEICTEKHAAQDFARRYRKVFFWVPEWGHWTKFGRAIKTEVDSQFDFGAAYWSRNSDDDVLKAAMVEGEFIRMMSENYKPKDAEWKKLQGWATKLESLRVIRNFIELAKPFMSKPAAEFDANPWLVNFHDGTVDVRNGGSMYDHRAEDFITRYCNVYFFPDNADPLNPDTKFQRCSPDFDTSDDWESFLDRVVPDEDTQSFLQEAAGYSLLGCTDAQVFFLVHGPTAAGKGVFLDTLKKVFGGYATQADSAMFMLSKHPNQATNDLARLDGVRFLVASETQEGAKLNESLIKSLTGQDDIVARFLFKEFFEFSPQLKIWLATNHLPHVADTGGSVWRRVRIVPFLNTIPEDERDPGLRARLLEDASGIARWAVAGAIRYAQCKSLCPSKQVSTAVEAYRKSEDELGEFLAAFCVVEKDAMVTASELFETYCRMKDIDRKGVGWFPAAMGRRLKLPDYREVDSVRKTSGMCYLNIRLRTEKELDAAQNEPIEGM